MYPISQIIKVIKGQATRSASDAPIEHLLIDSRKIAFPETSLFFAIVGARHDGHDFIQDVYKAGVRHFIVSQIIDNQLFTDAIFIKVNNVLQALQDLAAYHRSQFPKLKVIGITGSNGKTVVKEWLYQLLKDDYNIVRSPKSYNSQVGVPLSVWQIRPEHTLAIFEAGISQKGEMEKLERIIQPRVGIITNIGSAHDEGFASREEKLSEKLMLFKNCGRIYYKRDEDLIDDALKAFPIGVRRAWGQEKNANLKIKEFHLRTENCIIEAVYKNDIFGTSLTVPFKDAVSLENIIHCWNVALGLNIENSIINKRVKKLEPVAMRLELKAGINGCLLVDDAYNFDLSALQIALDFVDQQSRHLKKTVVLSDMLQMTQNTEGPYQTICQLLIEKKIERVIGIGMDILKLKNILPQTIDFQHFTSTYDFLNQLKNTDFHNEIILLKGARPFAFEQITNRLALKAHKTVLEINLNALVHNLHVFTQKLKPNVKIMAMVKAAAYGNGSDEVARLLEFHKVDYLAVAYADEGIDLRNAGVKLPIMVMNPEEASFDALRRFDLEPEIYSLSLLKSYADFVENQQKNAQNTVECNEIPHTCGKGPLFKIHLKLDTGMHRLGLESIDIQQVIFILSQNKKIKIASVFTHLAATEAAEHDGFTQQQVARFEAFYAQITEGVGYKPMRHVLNSSGITRHAAYQFEMVRLGIGLYGVDNSGDFEGRLQVVQTLKATISQIRNVPKTETVGYSRRGLLNRDARIATISIGYADGLLRSAGNGHFAVGLHGKRAPIVGSVCMDMTMIDVTDITEAMEGDEVEIFGNHIPVQALANVLNTIPYEIFTTISERVKRVYFQE
jgi:Alr-MurF fusion protein